MRALLLLLLLLSACGGSECDTEVCEVEPGQRVCPVDPATFVGPLPVECLK